VYRALACLLPILLLAACTRRPAPPAIDPDLAACIPPGTTALVGIRLDEIRATPVFEQLTKRAQDVPLLESASSAMVAWGGAELFVVARGRFAETPTGATLLAPGIVALGSAASVELAAHQLRDHRKGAPVLLAYAEPMAKAWPVWAVLLGGRSLPLSGNAANLNRVLEGTAYATLGLHFGTGVDLRAQGFCRSPNEALELESTLRALLTMARAGAGKSPEVAQLLAGVQLTQQDASVSLSVSASAQGTERLLGDLLPGGR
jgi:hypothetical protein